MVDSIIIAAHLFLKEILMPKFILFDCFVFLWYSVIGDIFWFGFLLQTTLCYNWLQEPSLHFPWLLR